MLTDPFFPETSNGLTHTYKYDLAGNRIDCAYGGISSGATGWHLTSAYDEQNRLTTLSQVSTGTFATLATTYTYDLDGNILVKTMPNGDADTNTYDAVNRTVSLVSTSGTNALSSYTYEYDAASNVAKVSESYGNTALNRTVSNTYDEANRLTQEVTTGSAALTTTYAYDKANNRTSMVKGGVTTTYSYNNLNQLEVVADGITLDGRVFYYDFNGRRWLLYSGGTTVPQYYFYNFENQLIGFEKLGDGYLWNFIYDYRNRRVRKEVYQFDPSTYAVIGDVFNKYVFSGGQSVREIVGSTPSVDYVRGSDWGGGVGGILYTIRSGVPSFTHYNRRGDVTSKVSLSGTVTYQATYEAFGKRVTETGATLDIQKSNTKDEDFPGYANEGFRYRDLETGVFLSPDPAGFVNGPNLYTYVRQNPWTCFDPEGLASDDTTKAGVTPTRKKHHIIPVETWDNNGLSHDVQKSLDEARIGVDGVNHGGAGHKEYNKRADKLVKDYIAKTGKDPSGLSGKDAKEFADGLVNEFKTTNEPYVRGFNAEVEAGKTQRELATWGKAMRQAEFKASKLGLVLDAAGTIAKWGAKGALVLTVAGVAADTVQAGPTVAAENFAKSATFYDVTVQPMGDWFNKTYEQMEQGKMGNEFIGKPINFEQQLLNVQSSDPSMPDSDPTVPH